MNNIEKYFEGEKLQCIAGIIIALIFIFISIYFLFLEKAIYKGMAYSFIPLSCLLLIICLGVVVRTPTDIDRVSSFYKAEPQKLQMEELPRMEKVTKNFTVVKKVEICFFIAGLLLAVLFWRNELIKGIAVGLMIQGVILYLFDYNAAIRGETYVQFLRSL